MVMAAYAGARSAGCQLAHVGHGLEVSGERDDALHRGVRQEAGGGGPKLVLDLGARERVGRVTLRCGAPVGVDFAVGSWRSRPPRRCLPPRSISTFTLSRANAPTAGSR
jgi:hypothetical protein